MTSTPESDALAVAAHDVALAALQEITSPESIGSAAGYSVEADGAVSLRFSTALRGYPGWFWTVSVTRVEGAEPTVLEAELLPGDDALLAPDWVPWADRLADYHAHQAELAAAAEDDESDEDDAEEDDESDFDESDAGDAEDDEDEDEDDLDVDDFDVDGDVDGVDIDELDAAADTSADDTSTEDTEDVAG